MEKLSCSVVGASGYTGSELVRLLLRHPRVQVAGLYARRHAGEPIASHFPHFAGHLDGNYDPYSAAQVAKQAKVAFLAFPHGESAPVARELLNEGLLVIDLSADFRLRSQGVYEQWYGRHPAPELLDEAVYGLVEHAREQLPGARLVASPGCYPTATLLGLLPLLKAGYISSTGIIVDAKSGVSGAGRTPSLATHLSETGEGLRAYKVSDHRHTPEIEQALSQVVGHDVRVTFTPHLVPMSRGILATCYANVTDENRVRQDYVEVLNAAYKKQPFVDVVDRPPETAHVRGSNHAQVAVYLDRRAGRVVVLSVIDNLVKGAAGQAIQSLNIIQGWPETEGLEAIALFP